MAIAIGKARVRRILFNGEKAIALELKSANDTEWGINVCATLRKDEHGNDIVSYDVVDHINSALACGFQMIATRDTEQEW